MTEDNLRELLKVHAAIQHGFVYLSSTSVTLAVRVQRHCAGPVRTVLPSMSLRKLKIHK